MAQSHHVIIVPGLDGRTWPIELVTRRWPKKFGLIPHIVKIVWKDGLPFEPKLQKIIYLTKQLQKAGHKVSRVGTSAGGVGILNAIEEGEEINNVNICGFSVKGVGAGRYSFEQRTASSPAFGEAIRRFEKRLPNLSQTQLRRILVLQARWDELVHPSANYLPGARNEVLPWSEHMLAIGLTLWNYPPMINFLKSD